MESLYDFGREIRGIAIDAEDNIFVANCRNCSIDKVSLNNGKVSITQSINISSSPYGLAINSKNEIYIGTYGDIKKMTKEGIISSIAGSETRGFVDGIGKNGIVFGICFDENDIAYFCDYDNYHSAIRALTPEGKITTICGGEERGYSDGKGEQAKFSYPSGIVYNPSTKLFYITDSSYNKSIRTMTADGNVNTLCKYSDYLQAIAIDGEGKLYVSTVKSIRGEGEIITVDPKGEIKQMKPYLMYCYGLAFNSKGDLFFASHYKLCVIRNCTKYPPHSILAPITNFNTKDIQSTTNSNLQTEIQELRKQLAASQLQLAAMNTEAQNLKIKLTNTEVELSATQAQLATIQADNQLLKKLETQNESLKIKLQIFLVLQNNVNL